MFQTQAVHHKNPKGILHPPQPCRPLWQRMVSLALFVLTAVASLGWMSPTAYAVPTNINISKLSGYQAETTIAIDPSNPNRMFVTSNSDGDALFAAYSTDAGQTWQYRDADKLIADGSDSLPQACCDPVAVFDQFGNLFLTYLTASPVNVVVISSSDGGQTFGQRAKFPLRAGNRASASMVKNRAPSGGKDAGCCGTVSQGKAGGKAGKVLSVEGDQPTVTVGPGNASGTGSVWISYNTGGGISVVGAAVTGLGAIGAFGTPRDTGIPGSFGDIAVGPNGQVLVSAQDPADGEGPANVNVSLDADGLGLGGFGTVTLATTTNVGGFDLITPQPNRSVDAEADFAWDRSGGPFNGRVYLAYTEETTDENNDTNILVRFSDNNGATWSAPVRANDDTGANSQFFPHIDVDQTTGNVAIAWYDARNDTGPGTGSTDVDGAANTEVQVFGTTSSAGGLSFAANQQISAGVSNGIEGVVGNPNEFGDYNGISFYNGSYYYSWADNSNSTGDNPDGARSSFDIYTARVQVSPPAPFALMQLKMAAISGGNGNSKIDPNECNMLTVTLQNSGTLAATGVTAKLTSNTAGVTVTQDTSAYPNLAASGSGANSTPFALSTTAAFVCGTTVSLTLTVKTSNAGTFVVPISLATGTLGTTATSFASTDVPKDIPDGTTTGVDSTIAVAGVVGSTGKVTVSLHITHTYDDDLAITLIAPDGTPVTLSAGNGSSGDNYGTDCSNRTTFDDAAATSIAAGTAPFAGTFKPQASLAALNGKSPNGTWKLRIADGVADDTGTLQCWSLAITPFTCTNGSGSCGTTTANVLALTVRPNRIAESSGVHAATGIVGRSGSLAAPLTVNLGSTAPSRITLPTSVVIPAGKNSISFFIGAVDNSVADGPIRLTVVAAATGYTAGKAVLTVTDNEASLGLAVTPLVFSETAGTKAATGTVTRNTLTAGPLAVKIDNSNRRKLTIPSIVTIPAGAASVTFPIGVIDNSVAEGPTRVKITARVKNYPTTSTSVTVLDNEARLILTVAPPTFSESAGAGAATVTVRRNTPAAGSAALVVLLQSGDTSEVKLPASVTIPAGAASFSFPLTAVDDRATDGTQSVTLAASAPSSGYPVTTTIVQVTDNES